jgi:hypothetical protein
MKFNFSLILGVVKVKIYNLLGSKLRVCSKILITLIAVLNLIFKIKKLKANVFIPRAENFILFY